EDRILWLWFGVPLLIAGFFLARPQTHIYVYFVPRAVLIGVIVAEGWAWLHQRAGVGAAVGAGAVATAAVVAVFGYHSYLYLVYNQVEVLRTWEENHPRFYWTPYDKVDVQSLYGFPLRSGWKVVGSLYDSG